MACYFCVIPYTFLVVLMSAIIQCAWSCRDCDDTANMKNEIDAFYDFHLPQDSNEEAGPCHDRGNSIAKARRAVFAYESWVSERSSCPWEDYYDEDMFGIRYPCRLYSARLVLSNSVPQRCLRHPGQTSRRTSHQFCEPLLQNVPVMVRTGCQNGCNVYQRRNATVAVGFTCVFHPH